MAAGDAIGVVEAAYRLDGDDSAWLRGLVEQFDAVIGHDSMTVGGVFVREPGGGRLVSFASAVDDPAFGAAAQQMAAETVVPFLEIMAPAPAVLHVMSDGVGQDLVDPLERNGGPFGLKDAMNVVGWHDLHTFIVLAGMSPRRFELGARVRARLKRMTAHVTAGHRLRRALTPSQAGRPESGAAVLSPDGRMVHAEDRGVTGAALRERLREVVRRLDEARGALRRTDPDAALERWQGLVDGRWSLVDHFDSDGKRLMVLRPNAPAYADPRALTGRERQVAHQLSFGMSNGEIAYALGLEESTVGTHVGNVLRKLRLRRREDVVRFLQGELTEISAAVDEERVSVLGSTPGSSEPPEGVRLTAAEREVFELLRAGSSRGEIARARGTSVATVGKQVSAVFGKLRVGSHAELLAKFGS